MDAVNTVKTVVSLTRTVFTHDANNRPRNVLTKLTTTLNNVSFHNLLPIKRDQSVTCCLRCADRLPRKL